MFKCLVIFVVAVAALTEGCPTIKGRSSWGARSPKSTKNVGGAVQYVIVHHTASAPCSSEAACSRQIKSIQDDHMSAKKKYDDIGYNFLIDPLGNVYEARGWGKVGAHAPGYNSKSVGISFIGNYQNSPASSNAIAAAKSLIACGVSNGKISSSYKLLGHRQTKATACPGDKLFQEIKTWPKWSSAP